MKVASTFIFLVCMTVASGSPMEESRQAEATMRQLDNLDIQNRKVDAWMADYKQEMAEYDALVKINETHYDEEKLCDSPETLKSKLDDVRKKIVLVEMGINATADQIVAFVKFLNEPQWRNITGLKEKVDAIFAEHIAEHDEDHAELQRELNVVASKEAQINSYPCPCVWSPWSAWGECSLSCAKGDQYRNRTITRNATNTGSPCIGANLDGQFCNDFPCPINCVWQDWAEWDRTWNNCNRDCGDGYIERKRLTNPQNGTNLHGGTPCTGPHVETDTCNMLDNARRLIPELYCQINCTHPAEPNCKSKFPSICP